jgi:O-methyltransferase
MVKFGSTICGMNAIRNLEKLLVSLKDIEGSVAEVGVYKGGSALIIAKTLVGDDIYLFDTFDGMPETCEFDNDHKKGDFNDSSYDEVLNLFTNYDNVKIIKGIFPDGDYDFLEGKKFKFVHLDVDIYKSYKDSLDFFHNRMTQNGIMLFDDYNAHSCLGAKKAVDEYVEKYKLNLQRGGDGQAFIVFD